jgi:anthranilate synthase component I
VSDRAPLVSTADIPPGTSLHRLAAAQPERYPVLLDSAAQSVRERFSLLCAAPRAALWCDATGAIGSFGMTPRPGGFLDNLEAWARTTPKPAPSDALAHIPFRGGWIVYVGYEIAAEIERRLRLPPARAPLTAFALRIEHFVVHDLATGRTVAVSEVPDRAAHQAIVQDIWNVRSHPCPNDAPVPIESQHEEAAELFLERVRRAQEHIAAGDVYQANLSRPWRLRMCSGATAGDVYAALRRSNPAPFAASVQFHGMTILSSSPERLLAVRGRDISTRPIAGTRPRHESREQDRHETAELVAHPKERAEHVMLIDLERNDLGRVCEAGSVEVDEYMATESYAHVHHIVSNVRGRLRADRDAIDALRALFPGGTITGCPKVRCMEIIAALEGEGRGAYTGSLGWLGTDGDADFNILIRTLTIQGRDIEFRAGAGIVADSVPERELEETRAKARGLLRAFAARP